MTPRRRWGVVRQMICCDDCPSTSSAMGSNDDIDWPVHSLMLSLHDLRGILLRWLPSTVPWSIIFGSVSWRHAWPSHVSLRRLTIDSKSSCSDVRRGYRPVSIHMLSIWHAKHSPVSFLFLKARIRLSRSAVSVQMSHPLSSLYWQDKWLIQFNLCGKSDGGGCFPKYR